MVAMYFHLPFLNPYLAKGSDFTKGANFAVAGATALDASVLAAQNISGPVTENSLRIQLQWFRSLLHTTFSNPRGTYILLWITTLYNNIALFNYQLIARYKWS